MKDESVLETIKIGDNLTLQREDNKFDSNAIIVLNGEKKKLGYVPEKDNIIFARLMNAGKLLMAKIAKIVQKGSFTQISIGDIFSGLLRFSIVCKSKMKLYFDFAIFGFRSLKSLFPQFRQKLH